jgi:hypothetical protein
MLPDPESGKNPENPIYAIPRIGGRRMKDFFKDCCKNLRAKEKEGNANESQINIFGAGAWHVAEQ